MDTMLLDFPRPRTTRQINFLLWLGDETCPTGSVLSAIFGGLVQLEEGGDWGHALNVIPRFRRFLSLCVLSFVEWISSSSMMPWYSVSLQAQNQQSQELWPENLKLGAKTQSLFL